MVNPSHDRATYLGGVEGAPPVPPPGGYPAAARWRRLAEQTERPAPRRLTSGPLGWAALAAAGVFGLVLLVMWAQGATDAIYGAVTLGLQLAVGLTVVAALLSARNRTVGAMAVALVLLLNVGTIGAASALGSPPGPASAGAERDHWAGYPGIKGQDKEEILRRVSLEDAQAAGAQLMAAIRERLGEEFGFAWVEGRPAMTRSERNGYGGESMLVEYSSEHWSTTVPVTDHAQKLAAMAVIDEVLAEFVFSSLLPLNDPATGFDPAYLERFYGSADVRTQVEWEWYADDWPGPVRFYANVTDLGNDADGDFRRLREAVVAGTAEPVEGLRISFYVREVLSADDVEEFERRMAEYGE